MAATAKFMFDNDFSGPGGREKSAHETRTWVLVKCFDVPNLLNPAFVENRYPIA